MSATEHARRSVQHRLVRVWYGDGPAWRTVDIVVAALVAAVFGVVFWAWGLVPYSSALSVFPPASGVLNAVFVMAGPLGALIVRKPGAALFTELVAALAEALVSVTWSGTSIIVYGLVQGLLAEVAFLVVRYRLWTLPVALLSGALAGLSSGVLDLFVYHYYDTVSGGYQLAYLIATAPPFRSGRGSYGRRRPRLSVRGRPSQAPNRSCRGTSSSPRRCNRPR